MTLQDVCEIKLNFPDADFWITRKGSTESVGKPTKQFDPEKIGVKVTQTDILLPDYLYYIFVHLHQTKRFEPLAKGTLRLQHISVNDIKKIKIG